MLRKEDKAGLEVTVALAVTVALQSRLSSTWANTTTVDPDSAPSPAGSWERAKAVAERDCRVTRLDDAVMYPKMKDSGRFESLHCVALNANKVLASTPLSGLHLQFNIFRTSIYTIYCSLIETYPKEPGVGGALVVTVM